MGKEVLAKAVKNIIGVPLYYLAVSNLSLFAFVLSILLIYGLFLFLAVNYVLPLSKDVPGSDEPFSLLLTQKLIWAPLISMFNVLFPLWPLLCFWHLIMYCL